MICIVAPLSVAHWASMAANLAGWLAGRENVSVEQCEMFLRSCGEKLGLEKLGPIVHPVRVALTGKTTGPGLFELMSHLGPERMKRRLARALESMA